MRGYFVTEATQLRNLLTTAHSSRLPFYYVSLWWSTYCCHGWLIQLKFVPNRIFILVYGNLPPESELADWEFAISQHSAVPQGILVCLHFKFYFNLWIYWMHSDFVLTNYFDSIMILNLSFLRISYKQCHTMPIPWAFLSAHWVPFQSSIQMQTLLLG